MSAKVVRDGLTILHTTIKEETLQSPLRRLRFPMNDTFSPGDLYVCKCSCGCGQLYIIKVEEDLGDKVKGVDRTNPVYKDNVVKKMTDEEVITFNFIRKVRGYYPPAKEFV